VRRIEAERKEFVRESVEKGRKRAKKDEGTLNSGKIQMIKTMCCWFAASGKVKLRVGALLVNFRIECAFQNSETSFAAY
jgi:hypothetical protein